MEEEGILLAKTSEQIMTLFLDPETGTLLAGSLNGHVISLNLSDNSYRKVKIMKGGVFGFIKNELGYFVIGDNGSLTQLNDELKGVRALQVSNSRCRAISFLGEDFCVGTSEGKLYRIDPFRMKNPIISTAHPVSYTHLTLPTSDLV